jgi:hypothetical protein
VAAHSTVRALYGAYSANLYQVRWSSDGTTRDVGVLRAAGLANAATHDSCRIAARNGRSQDLTPKSNNGKNYTTNVWMRTDRIPTGKVTLALTASGTASPPAPARTNQTTNQL